MDVERAELKQHRIWTCLRTGCRGSTCTLNPQSHLKGVNHCSLHGRLAKIRGLMYQVKYGAVIGRETCFFYVPGNNFQAMGFVSQSRRRSSLSTSNRGFSPNDSVNYGGW